MEMWIGSSSTQDYPASVRRCHSRAEEAVVGRGSHSSSPAFLPRRLLAYRFHADAGEIFFDPQKVIGALHDLEEIVH